jgi:hypothetical protein
MMQSVLTTKVRTFFSGWEAKEKIARPVVVNLTTALLVFLAALPFKTTIQGFFNPSRPITSYPLYCHMEPYQEGDNVAVDLFVINESDDSLSDLKLLEFVQQHSPDRSNPLTHKIEIRIKPGFESKIESVTNDVIYNEQGKIGKASAEKKTDQDWILTIDEIRRRAMLKVKILTTDEKTITSRADYGSLPIELIYAGRK